MQEIGKLSIELYRPELVDKQCRRVNKSDELTALIEEMTRLMKRHDGTGLAAPQVGIFIQLAIAQLSPYNTVHILINPEIDHFAGKDLLETESCLSLPPTTLAKARVWRSEIVHVRSGTLKDPEANELTIYKGLAARIVQHEIDHLQGVFFIDRCQSIARGLVLRAYKRSLPEVFVHG